MKQSNTKMRLRSNAQILLHQILYAFSLKSVHDYVAFSRSFFSCIRNRRTTKFSVQNMQVAFIITLCYCCEVKIHEFKLPWPRESSSMFSCWRSVLQSSLAAGKKSKVAVGAVARLQQVSLDVPILLHTSPCQTGFASREKAAALWRRKGWVRGQLLSV